jgi:hypothetical protein
LDVRFGPHCAYACALPVRCVATSPSAWMPASMSAYQLWLVSYNLPNKSLDDGATSLPFARPGTYTCRGRFEAARSRFISLFIVVRSTVKPGRSEIQHAK